VGGAGPPARVVLRSSVRAWRVQLVQLLAPIRQLAGRAAPLRPAGNGPPCPRPQVNATLPPPPPGRKWCRLVDTNLPSPRDFTPGGNKGVDSSYGIQGHSCIVLVARPLDW
jgi:hypothetical protein